MPALSPTMTQGKIVEWFKKEGDKINSGDVLASVETDKAAVDFETNDEGYLAKIIMPKGAADIALGVVYIIFYIAYSYTCRGARRCSEICQLLWRSQ